MPDFGRHMLAHWCLDPTITYLNHGTVGAPPRVVLEAQQAVREEIERQPARFLLREVSGVGAPAGSTPRLRAAAAEVAAFLGARGDDLVFVDNATTGVNAVLGSLDLREGDEILVTDHTYGAVAHAAGYYARRRGAAVRGVDLPHPVAGPDAVVEAVASALTPRTRVAVVDHVTSESALVLPVAGIAARCRKNGTRVLVDGAHAPGAIPVDIPALGVDWYTGNLHKWGYSARSCGILWAAPERQAGLHPPVISWGLDQGFAMEFDWTGTRDPSACLTAPRGLEFMRELGVDAVRTYNHGLAVEAARYLAGRFGTRFDTPESMIGTMATVPLPRGTGSTREEALALRAAIFGEDRIEIQLHAGHGGLLARVSGQVYNDMADVERLAEAVLARA